LGLPAKKREGVRKWEGWDKEKGSEEEGGRGEGERKKK